MSLEHGNNQNPELIARDLENSRSDLNDTISQIGDQLDPSHFIQDVGREISHYSAKTSQYTADLIRRNPTASLLTLAGIAWVFLNESRSDYKKPFYSNQGNFGASRDSLDRYSSRNSDAVYARYPQDQDNETLKEKTVHAASDLKQAALHEGEKLVQQGKQVKQHVTAKARELNNQASSFFNRNPLAVGTLGILTGIAIGSLIPLSRTEDELMGEANDRVTHRLASSGEHLLNKAKEVGKESFQEMKHEIKSEVDKLIPDEAKPKKAKSDNVTAQTRSVKTTQPTAEPRTLVAPKTNTLV